MPKSNGRGTDLKDKWLKVELTAPSELIDALSNFMTEIGAQGVFQETPAPESSNGFAEDAASETLNAYLPFDIRLEQRMESLKTYIEGLSQVFPDIEKPVFKTERIDDPNWGDCDQADLGTLYAVRP
jgi:ribosomal protein L11 methyltransferase